MANILYPRMPARILQAGSRKNKQIYSTTFPKRNSLHFYETDIAVFPTSNTTGWQTCFFKFSPGGGAQSLPELKIRISHPAEYQSQLPSHQSNRYHLGSSTHITDLKKVAIESSLVAINTAR